MEKTLIHVPACYLPTITIAHPHTMYYKGSTKLTPMNIPITTSKKLDITLCAPLLNVFKYNMLICHLAKCSFKL
jgi:hypothetical protein